MQFVTTVDSANVVGGEMPRAAARHVSIDLDDVLTNEKPKKIKPATTSIRLAPETLRKLDQIAKSRKMSRTKLLRNLINALISDWERRQDTRPR